MRQRKRLCGVPLLGYCFHIPPCNLFLLGCHQESSQPKTITNMMIISQTTHRYLHASIYDESS